MTEIAKCPKCGVSIDDLHPYSRCRECGEPLPSEIRDKLRALVVEPRPSFLPQPAPAKALQEMIEDTQKFPPCALEKVPCKANYPNVVPLMLSPVAAAGLELNRSNDLRYYVWLNESTQAERDAWLHTFLVTARIEPTEEDGGYGIFDPIAKTTVYVDLGPWHVWADLVGTLDGQGWVKFTDSTA
jgi:hypothetical protein